MILSPDPLFNSIIEILVLEKELSTKDLHSIIDKKDHCSLANFYKIIAELCEKQILFKQNGKLRIHGRWIHTISYIHDKITTNNS
jgi:predicted methyltransferase